MNDTSSLTPLETSVVKAFLRREGMGDEAVSEQVRALRVRERELSGVGFITRFEISTSPPVSARDPSDRALTGVLVEIKGLQHGADFVLFLEDGRIASLEGATFDEPWPSDVDEFKLSE